MKIAFYISSLSGGGAEKVLTILANRLADEGNDVHVISLEKRKQFYVLNKNVSLHKIVNKDKKKISEVTDDFKFIHKCTKEIKADISISFLSRCNIILLLTNLFNKERIIVCDRNNPLMEHSLKIFKLSNLLYRRANMIIVQTEKIKSFYNKRLQKKIKVQENPLDCESLYNQIRGKNIEKENTVISIGRLEKQKDFITLIKAYSRIMDKFPAWKLKIFGVGEMKEQLQLYIERVGAKNKILLCGHTHVPFYELKKSKIFVLSTHYEGFPNVLCEAMEAGLICISSNCISGPSELIENGENGWLFEIGDNKTLESLLYNSMKDETMSQIGAKAQQTTKRLHLDTNIDEWKVIINQVIK